MEGAVRQRKLSPYRKTQITTYILRVEVTPESNPQGSVCRRSKVSVPRKGSPSELHSLVTRADDLEEATVRTRHSEAKNSICRDEMWTRPSLLRSWQAAISAPHVPCIREGKPFDPAWP